MLPTQADQQFHPLTIVMPRTLARSVTLLAVCAASALAQTITFGPDAAGFKGVSWSSSQSSFVTFRSIDPAGFLQLAPVSLTFHPTSKVLFAFGNGVPSFGGIRLTFADYVSGVSFLWGNDNPGSFLAGGTGRFRLFDGTTFLEELAIAGNRNTAVDQLFSVSDRRFTAVEFLLDQNNPTTGTDLAEGITSISWTVASMTPVPEPSGVALLGLGLAGLGLARSRRRR